MELEKDTVITLENQEKYVVTNITFYGGVKYALALNEKDSDKVIIEEIIENNELFIKKVEDKELYTILSKILEP